MAFTFGNTSQTPFGATPKPTAFGTPLSFGTSATTTAQSTNFGGFGSSFGAAPATQASPFGSTFGTPATGATAPSFGSTFGAVGGGAHAFGSTFGSAAPTSQAPSFGNTFGAPSTGTGLFGSTATTKPGLFGAPAPTPSLFSTPASTAPSLFGTATSTQANLFGGTSTTPSLFGSTATSTAPLFGSFGTSTTSAPSAFGTSTSLVAPTTAGAGFSFFGTSTTSAPSLFGGGFGSTQPTSAGFSGFGSQPLGFGSTTTSTAPSLFGSTFGPKPVAHAGANVLDSYNQQLLASFYAINIFGDERDNILKKWNMLQACWGVGKGYYNANQPPVEYNHTNPFYRYKAIGYVFIPEKDNSEGLVKLIFNKKESELINQKEVLINGIWGILGNKQNLTVSIDRIKAYGETQCEVIITVSEKGVTGSSRKIPASDLSAFLNQAVQKQQLSNVGVTFIGAYMMPTKAQLTEYFKNPPPGIDAYLWQAAQADNPNPAKYLPAPVNGFTDLKRKVLSEEYETGLHRAFLEKVGNQVDELKKKHASSLAQIAEHKQKFLQLQHRVLRILVKQEITRKIGLALLPEEEILRGRFETMYTHLNVPTLFRGRINEIISRVKMLGSLNIQTNERYKMDTTAQEEIKQFLKMEQNGIAHLIAIINTDLKNLKTISDGLNDMVQSRQ